MAWVDITTPENGLADDAITAVRDEFGEAVIYTPQSTGVAEEIVAPFDDLPEDDLLQGMDVMDAASGPVIDVRLADLSVTPVKDDSVTVRGKTYEVHRVRASSRGGAKLYLHLVS